MGRSLTILGYLWRSWEILEDLDLDLEQSWAILGDLGRSLAIFGDLGGSWEILADFW